MVGGRGNVFINKVCEREIDLRRKKQELTCGNFTSCASATLSDFSFDCLSVLDSEVFYEYKPYAKLIPIYVMKRLFL